MTEKCHVCHEEDAFTKEWYQGGYALPMYEGCVVWKCRKGQAVFFPVCERCYKLHAIVEGNRYIHFVRITQEGITAVFDVINSMSEEPLARIKWYPAWRQYVIFPEAETVFNDGCLEAIVSFLKHINSEHKRLNNLRTKDKL